MDKIERIIDMTEHPERYTEDELRQLLIDDDEGNRIYKTITEINVAFNMDKEASMSSSPESTGMSILRKVKNSFINKAAAAIITICLISGITYAAVVLIKRPSAPTMVESPAPSSSPVSSAPVLGVSAPSSSSPVVKTYENTPLATIISDIARTFSKQQAYRTQKADSLRLYFRLDTRRGLEKNIEELNTFENINIEIKGDTLVVD
ncbi:MAG: FecR domain-containing protein [Prevotella sp.]